MSTSDRLRCLELNLPMHWWLLVIDLTFGTITISVGLWTGMWPFAAIGVTSFVAIGLLIRSNLVGQTKLRAALTLAT